MIALLRTAPGTWITGVLDPRSGDHRGKSFDTLIRVCYTKFVSYRRRQVDGALYAVLSGPFYSACERVGQPVPKAFQTKITRMLEIDRAWGIENANRLSEFGMAFHDDLPEGTGTDVAYSDFNAFVLAIAVEMLRIGFKQGEVVETLGLLRPRLQEAFQRSVSVLETGGRLKHVNASTRSLPISRRKTRTGIEVEEADHCIFLVLRGVEIPANLSARTGGVLKSKETIIDHDLCFGRDDLNKFIRQEVPLNAMSILLIEVSELAARLKEVLPMQLLRKRGRS